MGKIGVYIGHGAISEPGFYLLINFWIGRHSNTKKVIGSTVVGKGRAGRGYVGQGAAPLSLSHTRESPFSMNTLVLWRPMRGTSTRQNARPLVHASRAWDGTWVMNTRMSGELHRQVTNKAGRPGDPTTRLPRNLGPQKHVSLDPTGCTLRAGPDPG
jgi:hypothetical protein